MDANDTPELVQKQAGLPEYAGYSRSTTIHLAAAVAAIVIWGISFAVTRKAVQEIPPIALAFLRFSLASLVLWPVVRRLPAACLPDRQGDGGALILGGVVMASRNVKVPGA